MVVDGAAVVGGVLAAVGELEHVVDLVGVAMAAPVTEAVVLAQRGTVIALLLPAAGGDSLPSCAAGPGDLRMVRAWREVGAAGRAADALSSGLRRGSTLASMDQGLSAQDALIIAVIVCTVLTSLVCYWKGRSPVFGLVLGLVLGPLGLLCALVIPRIREDEAA